jgi:hypothetical protein
MSAFILIHRIETGLKERPSFTMSSHSANSNQIRDVPPTPRPNLSPPHSIETNAQLLGQVIQTIHHHYHHGRLNHIGTAVPVIP